jgi:hypothetical protein
MHPVKEQLSQGQQHGLGKTDMRRAILSFFLTDRCR